MRLYALLKVNVCLITLHKLKMIIEQSYIVNQHFLFSSNLLSLHSG